MNASSLHDLKNMMRIGSETADILDKLCKFTKEGTSLKDIERKANKLIKQRKLTSGTIGFHDYKYATCLSVNDVMAHGLPTGYKLKDGDMISIDVVCQKNGYYADTCRTVIIGENAKAQRIKDAAFSCMMAGIHVLRDGVHLREVARAVEQEAKCQDVAVVAELSGHGVGRAVHEAPSVAFSTALAQDVTLKDGDVITIEPIITEHGYEAKLMNDGWSIKNINGGLSAQYEHTVLITKNGYKILTQTTNEFIKEHIHARKISKDF